MTHLTLYYTSGCHLCQQAEALALTYLASRGLSPANLRKLEIADNPALLERYGTTIPVLRDEGSGIELNWPFGLNEFQAIR